MDGVLDDVDLRDNYFEGMVLLLLLLLMLASLNTQLETRDTTLAL